MEYALWPEAPAKVLRVSFSADEAGERLQAVEAWMAALGRWIYEALHFEVGVVGDGFLSDWTGEGFWRELPLRRSFGLLWPTVRSDGLAVAWYPPQRAD